MPWPLGEASDDWCTREDLNLHARRAAASEAAASAVSPRVPCRSRSDGTATADRTPVSALPTRCPATGRLRLLWWCWLEDSNLPPLAYEASALPDELSQRLVNGQKGTRRRSRSGSDRAGAPGSAPRPNLDVHNVKERGATGAVVTGERPHAAASARRDARAPGHTRRAWMYFAWL